VDAPLFFRHGLACARINIDMEPAYFLYILAFGLLVEVPEWTVNVKV
jgi:hypothetical protein